MRCREAKIRLSRLIDNNLSPESDPRLTAHLAVCSRCAEQARIAELLAESLRQAKADDNAAIVPAEIMRQRVEADIQSRSTRPARRASTPIYPLVRRLVLGAIPALVTFILVMTVIPVSHNRITGWQVALEGVSLDLGQDDHLICEMLFEMGLMEAAVDVIGCDTTCCVLIFDLKTRTEAQLVVSALSSIDSTSLNTDVVPVRSTITRSLWQRVNEGILNP